MTATIGSVTPTLCTLFGVSTPNSCGEHAAPSVVDAVSNAGIDSVEKCLIYAPDALGVHVFNRYSELLEKVRTHVPIQVSVQSVVPSVTPVCFASMFTGAAPAVHGIRKYEKPVLSCDTLFDAFLRAGKRVAIVAVADCSIDRIFRNRQLDYFSETYDQEVTQRAIQLLEMDRHDLIVAYHQEYDDLMHKTGPFGGAAVEAIHKHVRSLETLSAAVHKFWRPYNRVIAVTPDHGAHWDEAAQRGDHGLDIPEDMDVFHFYGVWKESN